MSSASESPASQGRSLGADALARFGRDRVNVLAFWILTCIALACLIGPWFLPSLSNQDLTLGASAPSWEHWMGTDVLGRDLFSRVLNGGRISLMVGLVASGVALIIGVFYGAVAGSAGGRTDALLMRLVDILYALPFTVFVILIMVFLKEPVAVFDDWLAGLSLFGTHPLEESRGLGRMLLLFAAIGAVEWLTMARIVRGQVIALRKLEFVEAARALGIPPLRILLRHMIPNALGPVIVYTTLTIPAVMLLEAFLSYLGLGVEPPMSSWGTLIRDGAEQMEEYPWLLAFPASLFSLTLLSLNLVGDGLRDALDVKGARD